MRIGLNVLSLASLFAVAACNDTAETTYNPVVPSPTMARVRIFNATADRFMDFGAGGQPILAVNSNITRGVSRCIYNVDPANPQIVVNVGTLALGTTGATRAALTIPQTGFEAGKSYFIAIYHPTAVVTDLSSAKWETDAGFSPATDSAGLRFFNAAPGLGPINTYINTPAVAPAVEPLVTTLTPKSASQAVGTLSSYFNVIGAATYQYRVLRTSALTATTPPVNTTNSLVKGTLGTVVVYPASTGLTTTTSIGASTTGGC